LLGGMGQDEVYKVTAVPKAHVIDEREELQADVGQDENKAIGVHKASEQPLIKQVMTNMEEGQKQDSQVPKKKANDVQEEGKHKVEEAVFAVKQDGEVTESNIMSDSEGGSTQSGGSAAPTTPSREPSGPSLAPAADEAAHDMPQTGRIAFVCDSTQPGQCLALVGADPVLGGWDVQKAVRLTTSASAFPTWSGEVELPAAGSEFKLVIVSDSGEVSWEPISGNRIWPADVTSTPLVMFGR